MPHSSSSKLYAYLALGAGLLILGSSGLFVRWADAPGTITACYRMGIPVFLLAYPFLRQVKGRNEQLPRKGVLLAVLGGSFFGCDMALWATGVTMSGATNPTLMSNTAPVWVGLGSVLIFRERQHGKFWVGLSMALAGAAVVMMEDASQATELGWGTFLGLLAGIFYGAFHLVSQKGRVLLNTFTYFYITTGSSFLILFLCNVLLRQPFTGYRPMTYVVFLAYGAVVQMFGWLIINYAQGYLPATIVAPTLLGQPVVTAVFASLLLGETFTLRHIVGGVAVLFGVYVVHRSRLL